MTSIAQWRLIILGPLITLVACAEKPAAAECSPAESAECFAADFYSWYTGRPESGGAGMDMSTAIAKRPSSFTPSLLSAIAADNAAQAAAAEIVGLNGDGFINAQDPCERYVTGKAQPVGDRFRVPVYAVCQGRQSDSVALFAEVARVDSGFEFTNFIYDQSDLVGALAELRKERNDNVVVPGACPFECCGYGKWTFNTTAPLLRYAPGGDSIGFIPAGEQVSADSGFVWLNPSGMAIVTDTTLDFDMPTRPPVKVGDTLYVLNYHGEGYFSVRWRDTVTFTMGEQWDSTGRPGAKLIRKPAPSWWVHVTRPSQRGWVEMKRGVEVRGADLCGG